jgi:hypothetical protein
MITLTARNLTHTEQGERVEWGAPVLR